jgi:hypothetical protein
LQARNEPFSGCKARFLLNARRGREYLNRWQLTFSEALTPLARRMPQAVRDVEILRVAAQLDGDDFDRQAKRARDAALTWAKRRAGGNLPKDAWDHLDFELLAGGRNSAGVRFKTDTADLWAIRAEDPDKDVAGRIWTTEIVIGGEVGKRPHLSLRLIVSTAEPEFSIEPHVPGTVLQMISTTGLVRSGRVLRDVPATLRTENDAEDLCDHLEDPDRRLPIFVVTLPEGEAAEPLINDAELAKATAGIARVVRLPADLTWVLTKRFGKFRSVFDGAVRAYLPGFSNSDDPYRHRLFLAAPLHDAENAQALWHLAAPPCRRSKHIDHSPWQRCFGFRGRSYRKSALARHQLGRAEGS